MPGCVAVGCSNRSEKGFLMKCFPRDPLRRKQWETKVRREGWIPTNTSFICEVHFEPHMWEKTRVDGTRKLKHDAIPTLFSFTKNESSKRKPPKDRNIALTTLVNDQICEDVEEIPADIWHIEDNETVQPLVHEEAMDTSVLRSKVIQYKKHIKNCLLIIKIAKGVCGMPDHV